MILRDILSYDDVTGIEMGSHQNNLTRYFNLMYTHLMYNKVPLNCLRGKDLWTNNQIEKHCKIIQNKSILLTDDPAKQERQTKGKCFSDETRLIVIKSTI